MPSGLFGRILLFKEDSMRKESLWFGIVSLMGLAILFCAGCSMDPAAGDSVTGVTVSPKTATVAPGGSQAFAATVAVTGNAAQTVSWTVTGTGKKDGTTISTAGVLTVATDETASLTVTATAGGQSDTATVTVESLSITIGFAEDVTVTGESAAISKTGANDTPTSLTLTAVGYTGTAWYVDGNDTAVSTESSITLEAEDYNVRRHWVTFTGTKDRDFYAKEIPFTVVE
jgi:hypothetical protein